MGQVTVSINDRIYTVACGDGEEAHLKELASYLSNHVNNFAREVGHVGEARLLLMAGLTVADELSELMRKLKMLEAEIETLSNARAASQEHARQSEDKIADVLDATTRRIEDMARRIEAV